MPEDTLASVGSSKRLECRVIGYPIPRITWLKDDVNIGRSDRFKFDYSVDGLVTMEIENVTYADVGSYQCLAVNSEGWASTTAHLKVKGIGTDNTDDTMTVHRMTFDNSGTRKDSSKRPLVISDTAIDDTNGDFMGVDALNRTLSPGGVRQLDITGSLDNAISLKEDNYKTFLGDNANQSIENNLEQNADKRLNCDVGLSRADLKKIENGEHVSRDVVPRDSVDIDENDSGVSSHFSSSSSVNKKQANDSNKKDDKITISVIEEDLIKETNAMKRENVVDDLVGFLKADDRSNRSRRLTNDSGIADDDYSSLSSEEDVDNTGNKRRRSSAKDGVQNKIQKPHDIDKSNTDISTCHPNVSEISVISDNNLNQIENIQNVPDSITERLQAEENGDRLTKPKIKNKDSSATNEIQEDSNELTDFGNSELETAENVQMLCISDSMESCIENEITTHQPLLDKRTANDQTMDGLNNNDDNLISAMNVQKMDPVVQNNAKGDLDTSTEMDDSLLSGKTQKVDQLTTNANGDLDKSQKMDDSLLSGKTQEVDQLTPNANGDLDKSKKMGDSLLQGKTHEVDPLTTKKPDQRNIDNIDKLDENERDSSDGDLHDDEMFHSDEEEHKILAEIRPNNRVQKIIHDETRSNTLSFQSMESWSIYESCDDYTLSDSNFDTISYQNIDDDEFFMARHDSKSGKGDSRSTKEEKSGDQDNISNTDDVDAPVDEKMERVKNDAVQNKMKVNTVECLSKDATKDVACDATQNTSINTDSNGDDKNRNSNNMDHSNDEIKNRQEIDHNGDQVMGTTGESAANARLESSHLKDSKEIDTRADQTGKLDQQNDKNRDSGQNGKGIKTDDGQSPNDDINVDRDNGSSLDGQSPNNDRNVDRDNGSSLDGQSPNDDRNVDRDNGSSLDGQSPNDDRNVDRDNGSSLDGQSPNDDRNVDRDNGSSLDGQSPNDDRNVDRDNGSSLDGQSPNDDRNVDRDNGSSLERNKDKKVDGQFENNNSTPTKPKFMDELEKHTNITLDDHEFRWESDDSLCRDTGNAKLKARNNVDKIYYSSDEYFDDESDLSVEDIEEEKCDILQKLDLSSYVINDSGKKQLTTLDEMSSTESSDHNENESESKDAISKNKTKSDGKNDVNSAIGVNKDKNNSKPAMRKLEYLHSMSKYDNVSDESGNLEKISDTRPALPNTLFLKDQESIARMMDRVASETNTQLQLSPELEDGEFDEFVNLLTVIPGKDVRPLLSPIVEEGPVSHTSESIETTSSSSPEDNNKPVVAKKTKRPSLIDLIVTDTDGSVEQINLEKMDALQSFSEPHYVTVPNGNTEQDGIPRIIKGPSSVTAMDGGEIVLKWNILGCPEPEVAVFKDGDSLQLCDEITLNKDETTWTLTIQDVIKEDAGLYEICAVNSIGNDILKTRVYVKTVNRAPVDNDETDTLNRQEGEKVVPNFLKSPKDLEVKEGEVTLVECQILGDPRPQVVWLKDEEPIYPDERVEILQDDAKCQLIIKPTTQEDAGTYTCRASNSVGVNQVQFSVEVANNAENKVKVDNNEDSKNIPQITWNSGNDQDHVDEPSAPVVQLDMSESDECFSRKFRIVSDYHDEFNDVDLIEGEITEVLDRSKQTHWLVRSLKDPTKVCYVPTYLLENTKDENVSRVIQGRNEKNPVAAAEIHYKTKKIMTELIESETDYICDLKDLIDTYKSPIDEGEITPTIVDKQSGVLNTLTQLYQFHKETLLPNLIENSEDAESVGDIFSQKRASFSEYVPFCSEHDKAMDSTDVDQMQALMEAFSLIMGDPDSAFEDLMNRPLDRIHEYIEILKTLIKLTAQAGGDCSGLMAAVQMLSEICRTMEDIVLLDRIEGYQGDVKELGPVLKHEDVVQVEEQKDTDSEGQGHIESEGQKPRESEGQRHVILFPDKIMVTKPMTSDPKGKLEFEKIIELKDVSIRKQVETTDDGACTIELWEDVTSQDLSASSPSLKLHVQDLHTKQTWVRDIQEAKKKLELKNTETDTMPEFRQKLKGKKLTSTPKKRVVKNVDTVEIESDRSSDDFNILGTRKDLQGDRYVAAEFEDGTTRPIFRRKLQKTIVGETSTAKLECEVAGIPQPKVLWLKNNRPLVESDHCKVISDGAVHTLEFTDTRKEDTGLYTARAMNVNGSTISTAELYIGEVQPTLLNKYKEGLSDSKYQTPAYFFQMNSCQVEEGRLARFDCRVVAYPKPDIVWMKDGKVVEPNDRYKLLNFNNEIYSLLIQNVVKGDMGRYTCWAHNKYGEAMTEAYLNVIAFQDQQDEGDMAPQFLTRFYDQTLTEGVPAELQCLIDGRPMPTIKWLFNDIEIIPSDNLAILQDKNLCSLCIKEVTQKDLGTYTCNLKNALGVASCSAGLNVLNEKIKNVPILPKFLKKISDQNMRTGEGVTFEVVVIGEPPPKVVWLFNHKPISDARRRFKITQDGDVYKLTIEDLILDDDGKITCKATNSEGEVYSSGNLLVRESRKVSEQPDEQKFTQKDFDAKYGYLPTFMKKIDDILVPSGKDGKFECRIMGIPEPTVTWKKNGLPITSDGRHWMSQDGGCCFLTIRGVTDRDQGVYTCTIANAAGENSCTAYMRLSEAKTPGEYFERESSLTPRRRGSVGRGEVPTMPYEKPTISDVRPESTRLTWQPVLTSALSSDSKNIKYIIEGRELPDAEWKKMASGIHGNTHMLRNLRPQKEYDFRVRAENQFGLSDSTQPATLERPKPEIDEFVTSMKSKVTQFRRPPELPRSKPLIADMGAESVKLAWQPAVVSPAIKKPPPVTYRLEAQELPASDWLPLSSRLSDTSHYLSDLLPDRDYNIRVRAENKYGLSEPTEPIWIPRAKAFPGVPIARPEIIEMEPNMVKLRWERVDVPSFSADDQSLRYMIEMQTPPAREWSSVARDIAGTVYVVSDLEPGQDYRFRVRARTPLGVMSEPSPVTSIYRTIATTVAPIDSLELEDEEDVDFDGIRLRWNRVQIPPYTAGEEPLLYMIEMNEPPLDEWRPIISGLPTTRYRVSDLVPDRDYHFRVRALSSYGISPPSYTLPVSYRRPLPGPSRILPEYPRIVYDESDALQLSWQPPKISTPIKEPIKYRVELQAPPSLSWKPLATGIPDTRYPIRGLGPSRDYMFRVVPETSTGLLEPLPPVSLTSLPAPRTFLPSRPEILDYEPDSLMLSWRRPYVDTHLPVMYRIDVQEPPSLDWRPLMSDVTDTSYRVTGLRPSRDYSFRIVPYSGTDHWEPLPPVTLTSLPVKPRFIPHEPTITPIGADSVKLSWKPADIPMYPRRPVPISYIVEMRTRPGYDWTPMARNVMNTSYIVKGLNPSKEYQFRVSPQTDYGIGEPTMPATFYRKPVPLVRHEPVVSNIYGDSVLLSWQPAEFKGDFKFPPSVTYSIEIQDRPGVGPWTPFITGIQGTSYHVTGLHPDREYFFRVRGHAGDVFGEPSAPVYLTHRAGPPRIPQEQPYISELSPNSVHLQWRAVQLPSRITDYAPVSYRLEIQELPRSDWVILADGIPHTDFHVINLLPDKEYNFRVRAVNKYGCSEPTSLVQLRRRAIPPKMPKDEPLIYDIGHGSLMLSWRPADVPYYLDEKPVTYTIYVQDPPSTTWRPLYRRIPYTSYHVTNLQPDRDYCFRVQAENIYGLSQPTNAVRLTRLSDFRSPIDIPEITDFDETRSSLQLRWTPRKMTPFDKTPLKYHIESWEPIKRTWRRLATDIPDTSYRLTGLSPENDYILRVRAQAESILSEPSYPVSTNRYRGRVPITRPQLFDVESDSVRLSWQPYPGTATPRRYKLELRESSARDWRSVTTDVYGTTHKVTGLKPKQDYQFRLRGVMDQGQTDYVYSVPLHRRTVVPRLPLAGIDIVNVEDDYVDLSWKMVDVPAFSSDEKPLAFLIEAQQLPRYDWLPVASGISDTGYRVKGLQRNQDYTFRLRGEYPSGLSQPSQHVSVYRRPIRPGVPISRPEIFDDEPNSARLRWQRVYTPPYHHHSEPLSYQIELQEAPYRNWRPLARGITMTEHTITDLMPKKDYLFRIRAETPNGDISAPTPPIAYYKSHLPSPRTPRKTVDYKMLEQDFSVPTRSYIDHLTTFIPPRLPLDKPDMTEDDQSTVSLRWRPALVPDRARDKYPVTYSIEVKNPPNLEWRDIETGLTGLSHTLKNIHPEFDYMFRIRAHNEFGSSEATLPVSLYRPIEIEQYYDSEYDEDYEYPLVTLGDCEAPIDEVPPKLPMETPKMTNITGERAMLHWLPARIPAYAKKVPITYIVEIKEDNMPGFSRFQSGLTDTKFYIEGLNPSQSYQFRVKAETQFGCSDPTLAVVLDRNKDKVKRPSTDIRRDDLDIPQAKMRDVIPSGVPPRMSSSRPLITNRYGGNLSLTWGPGRVPSYVKGSTMTYIVEKREPPQTNWTILADNLLDNDYDVSGLSPDRDYMFRVRAKNQFGTSDPTMPCSVINVKDDYVPPVFSRSQSRDSGTPRILSRRSSIESPLSLSRQMSLDENDDTYRSAMPPEFKSITEETQYGVLGKTAKVSLAVRGFPLPLIEWTYKGDNLCDMKKYKSFISPSGVITLEIFDFCMTDVGEYKCRAENDHGYKSIIIQLEYADAPTFIEPTVDLYLDNHRKGKFECKVDGVPYPKIRWMKDWRPVTESSRLKIHHTKPNQWSLHLSDVISLDGGLYTCVAENIAGKSMCSANLFVDEMETTIRPVIFRQAVFEDYFYVLEELGRGRHGVVRKVIEKSTGNVYAAKIIPACNEDLKYFFGHELNNLRSFSNQRVPYVIDAFQSERQLIIVMELIKGKSLVEHILNQDTWCEYDVVCYIKQLLEILRTLHGSSIVHLDIKPSNIQMSTPDSDQIRLIDFGFSRHLSMDYDIKMNYGTEEFTSPEQIKNEPLTTAADMWSVGILTYILLSGVSPLRGEDDSDTLKKVLKGKINLSKDNFKVVSEDAKDFLAELLVVDPCDRLTVGECLQHPWIKEAADRGKGQLDLGHLSSFQARDTAQRKATYLRSVPRLQNLTSILQKTISTTTFTPSKDDKSGERMFPESEYFGEYLDEESWYDWQNRYHKGPGAKVVPLSETDYLARVRGSRPIRRVTDVDMDDDEETMKRTSVLEEEKVVHEDSCLQKELQYVVVADDVKQRKQASKDLFPKEDIKDENPQILSKFYDTAFTPGEEINLTCSLEISETPAVSWYRNEELVSDGSRVSIKIFGNGTTLTIFSAKPYDAGIYKCIVRSKGGKATAAARVLVGDVPNQPSRPVAMQVSSHQVLLLWEQPTSNGNSCVLGYRVDYRKTKERSWLTGSHPIDECTIISDMLPDTSYRFRVCAVNQFGSSAYSVASAEIVTLPEGDDKIHLDEYTSAILARQQGRINILPTPPAKGVVQLTEGSFNDKYDLVETVYSGKFSEFKIAKNISTGRTYGAKIISCTKDKMAAAKNEFEILRIMNQEMIVRLYDGFLFNEKLYFIMEYLYGVNVLQHFAFKTKYTEDMVAIVIRQVLEGVQYLQHVGVVHLNLQPSSIVMRSRRHLDLKITGFSHARKISGNGEVVPCVGYPDFMAPEVVTREITSYPADIWTVGVLCFLLLSGESPFRGSDVEEIYSNVAYNRYDAHDLYENITRDALRFINRILKRISRNRLSLDECLDDKWLQVTDTTVKARQDSIFSTAKLRSFADLYRERGILGSWMPTESDLKEEPIREETDDKEKEEEVKPELTQKIEPEAASTPQAKDVEEDSPAPSPQSIAEKAEDSSVPSPQNVAAEGAGSPAPSPQSIADQGADCPAPSPQNIADQVAETVVTGAIEQALDSEELKK